MKKVVSFVLVLLMLFSICIQSYATPITEVKQGMKSRVFITGSLGENYAERTITMFVTEKDVDLSTLKPSQLWYISELKTDESGYYELLFEVDETKGAYDIYVNETGKKLEECTVSDYSENIYIDVDINVAREENVFNLAYKIRNIFGYDDLKYDLITAWYLDGTLKNVVLNPIDLSGSTYELNDEFEIEVPDEQEVDQIKFFVWKKDDLQPATKSTMVYNHYGPEFEYINFAEETTIKLAEDTKNSTYQNYVKYSGRWSKNENNQMQGYWTRPYVELRCDTNCLKANIKGNFYLYVNGELAVQRQPGMSKGVIEYDFSSYLKEGVSEIMIMGSNESQGLIIDSVTLGANSRLYVNREKDINMLFIGDSITSANGYSVMVPLALDADFTVISKSASNLCDEHGVSLYPEKSYGVYVVGHETQFDRLETFQMVDTRNADGTYTLKADIGGATPYIHHSPDNYSDDNFDVVFFGLGTNDELQNDSYVEEFKSDMEQFIQKLKSLYPDAKIVVTSLLPSNGQTEIEKNQYAKRNNNYKAIISELQNKDWWDERVKYFDMTDLDLRYEDTADGEGLDTLHPHQTHDEGHKKIAGIMLRWLVNNKIIE